MTGTTSKPRRDFHTEGHGAKFVLKNSGLSLALEVTQAGLEILSETAEVNVGRNQTTNTKNGVIVAAPGDSISESITSITVV